MSVSVSEFGRLPGGEAITKYTIANASGASASLIDYGATWQAMLVPNRSGKLVDVVLGYDTIEDYQNNVTFFGATVGRVANRMKNARFSLNGEEYRLFANDGPNCLHGGKVGFDKKMWTTQADGDAVMFSLTSPDGDEGFPGALSVAVVYALSEDNALSIRYLVTCDQDTVQNLTNHAYFNLAGQGSGPVLGQLLQVRASQFTRIDGAVLPTGEIAPVAGTPLDFTQPKPIGRDIESGDEMIARLHAFDHNFVLDHPGGDPLSCTAVDPVGGVAMDVYTDQPGVQLYTPPDLTGLTGKGGVPYGPRPGFCLETQHFASATDYPQFPSIVLRAGEVFTSETTYRFRVEG